MDRPPVFRGSLAERQIPEILYQLSRTKETGTLLLKNHVLEKSLFFEEGKIVFASSSDPDDRLGALLLHCNKITRKQLEECAAKVGPGKRLGTVLVLEGILQPNDLYHAVIDQIKEIVYSVFDWDDGSFEFQPGALPQKEAITLNQSSPDLIMTGMLRISKWSWIRKALPDVDAVFRKKEGWSPVVRKMNLTREIEALVDLFDRPRTLDEVLRISSLGNFETCRLIWIFLTLGIIGEILVAPQWGDNSDETTARIEPSSGTEEMPAPAAQPASPTLKVTVFDASPEESKPGPNGDLEPQIMEDVPYPELSFSDLAGLTDPEEQKQETVPQPAVPSPQPWETLIHPELENFNEIHRYLFEMISLELGNGTNSFLSKVFRKASVKYPLVFEGVSLNEFGEMDESSLLLNIQGNLVQDYSQALDYLITEERSMISLFLEMKRVEVIEAGLKRIVNRRIRTVH
jgi:Domain of unknown function (DUF4388)